MATLKAASVSSCVIAQMPMAMETPWPRQAKSVIFVAFSSWQLEPSKWSETTSRRSPGSCSDRGHEEHLRGVDAPDDVHGLDTPALSMPPPRTAIGFCSGCLSAVAVARRAKSFIVVQKICVAATAWARRKAKQASGRGCKKGRGTARGCGHGGGSPLRRKTLAIENLERRGPAARPPKARRSIGNRDW